MLLFFSRDRAQSEQFFHRVEMSGNVATLLSVVVGNRQRRYVSRALSLIEKANPNGGTHIDSVAFAAKEAGATTLNWGLFLENVVNFLITALFLYFALKKGKNRMTNCRCEPSRPLCSHH